VDQVGIPESVEVGVHLCSSTFVLCSVRVRGHSPMDDHWCFRLRSLARIHFAQLDSLLSS
jgi:hypothetical protein